MGKPASLFFSVPVACNIGRSLILACNMPRFPEPTFVPMMFQFHHSSHACNAYLVHRDGQPKNLLIVYNLDFNDQLGYEIIFYRTDDEKWRTNHAIKERYPDTYSNLCDKISEILALPKRVFSE